MSITMIDPSKISLVNTFISMAFGLVISLIVIFFIERK